MPRGLVGFWVADAWKAYAPSDHGSTAFQVGARSSQQTSEVQAPTLKGTQKATQRPKQQRRAMWTEPQPRMIRFQDGDSLLKLIPVDSVSRNASGFTLAPFRTLQTTLSFITSEHALLCITPDSQKARKFKVRNGSPAIFTMALYDKVLDSVTTMMVLVWQLGEIEGTFVPTSTEVVIQTPATTRIALRCYRVLSEGRSSRP